MNRQGGIIDCGHECREPGTSGVMTIFIPPSIFAEVETVFDSPVISDVAEDVERGDGFWIEAGDEVPLVVQHDLAVVGD